MLLTSLQSPSLQESLVLALSKNPACSATRLNILVSSKKRKFSIQAIYKELRNLQAQGIVFKQKQLYSLSLAWIINLWNLTNEMLDLHYESSKDSDLLSQELTKKTYIFSRFSHVDDFWINALFLMLQNSNEKILYQWLPHPWFHLIHSKKSWTLHKALKVAGFKVDSIIGGKTFLDVLSKDITTKNAYEFHYANSQFAGEETVYYSVTDSYLLTVHLSKATAKRLEELYRSVKTKADLDLQKIYGFMNEPVKITVTIEKNTSKNKKIWNKFKKYFLV